jgi:hypothetical protein
MPAYKVKTTKACFTIHGHSSAESARRAIMAIELCPESAIVSVQPVKGKGNV